MDRENGPGPPKNGSQSHVYEIRDGKMLKSDSPAPYVATITMSANTFLQILNSAMDGTVVCPGCRSEVGRSGACGRCHAQVAGGESYAEYLFEWRYATRNNAYQGERWIVD